MGTQATQARSLDFACSMWGSNPRPLAHKTNTLPTELMERLRLQEVHFYCHHCEEFTILYFFVKMLRLGADCFLAMFMKRVRGLVVMIVACQVMDPGSIPGERNFFCVVFFFGCLVLLCCCAVLHVHLHVHVRRISFVKSGLGTTKKKKHY